MVLNHKFATHFSSFVWELASQDECVQQELCGYVSSHHCLCSSLQVQGTKIKASAVDLPEDRNLQEANSRTVIFVGNNLEGAIDVIDLETYAKLGRINGTPDRKKRLWEIYLNPFRLLAFLFIKTAIGEGNNQ